MSSIPFNKPYLSGKEAHYLYQAVYSGKISGNGIFTKRCQQLFEQRYAIGKALLTSSCTDALEMSALLLRLAPGDEVIMPSYTFVSTANAFLLRGVHIRFADSYPDNPNIDPDAIEPLINANTKAIVVVHYAGIACDMDRIMEIAQQHQLWVVEDAAQAVESFYKGRALGSIGHLSAFSFHETKNIMAGEGGLLGVNEATFAARAEIIWEKGTNRAAFFRGEIDKYGWVDIGSSFLASEIVAAFLYAQLENLEDIQARRRAIWETYRQQLLPLAQEGLLQLPLIPDYASNNAHLFYIVAQDLKQRTALIEHLRAVDIHAVFHYLSLHSSPYYKDKHDMGRELPYSDRFSDCLLRLPLFYELSEADIERVVKEIFTFFKK